MPGHCAGLRNFNYKNDKFETKRGGRAPVQRAGAHRQANYGFDRCAVGADSLPHPRRAEHSAAENQKADTENQHLPG